MIEITAAGKTRVFQADFEFDVLRYGGTVIRTAAEVVVGDLIFKGAPGWAGRPINECWQARRATEIVPVTNVRRL
jgi:hypothetical protein